MKNKNIETNITNETIYSTNVQVGLTARGRGGIIEKIVFIEKNEKNK